MTRSEQKTQTALALSFIDGAIERIREGGDQSKYDYAYTIGAITAYAMLGIIELEQANDLRERAYDALTIIEQ